MFHKNIHLSGISGNVQIQEFMALTGSEWLNDSGIVMCMQLIALMNPTVTWMEPCIFAGTDTDRFSSVVERGLCDNSGFVLFPINIRNIH